MEELKVINEQEVLGKSFRIYGTAEEPLFLAKDVASLIELTNVTDMVSRVDPCEVTKLNLGGLQGECNFLTEDGLYEVLMQSRKPIAKEFKRKVKEILKGIRKHGAYMTEATLEKALTSPDFLIKLATELKEEQTKRKIAEQKIEEQKPLVEFATHVTDSKDCIDMNELSKVAQNESIKIGRNKLFDFLRDKKIIMRENTQPYQRYVDNGWFNVVETTKHTVYGDKIFTKTLVKPKGQIAIIEMLRENFS